MRDDALQTKLFHWIKAQNKKVRSPEIEKYAIECGYSAENGRRKVRYLVSDGFLLQETEGNAGYAVYWWSGLNYLSVPEKKVNEQRERIAAEEKRILANPALLQ